MLLNKSTGLLCLLIIGAQTATAATFTKIKTTQPSKMVLDSSGMFHNQIHNFYFNDYDKSKSNYLAMQSHALAMSYDTDTHYLVNSLPGDMDSLKRILLHNAYYIPLRIDFTKHQVKYTASYLDAKNQSTVNPSRIVWNSYPINNSDITILKGYGCALSYDYNSISTTSTLDDANRWYRIDKEYGVVIVNWQSKFVVADLAKKTIQSLQTERYDNLFLDDIPRNPGNCVNKDYGGQGSYSSWKEGQLAFLQLVTDGAHAMKGRLGEQIKVFGNIWSPYADTYSAKWYAEKKLRLDHYYFESGGYAREDATYGQAANGKDPETGLPAYFPVGGGYIPANLVSVSTSIPTMNTLASGPIKKEVLDDYMMQHYKAAGIGAAQGSWFGWYGETSVDKVNSYSGQLIHSNAMQLLRAIPNWENIAKVPLGSRQYDKTTNVYSSPRSKFSNSVIQGWNPVNNEIYAVFRSTSGQVDLMGKKVITANFVNPYFSKTSENALTCLSDYNNKLTLKCADKIEQGIRITIQ